MLASCIFHKPNAKTLVTHHSAKFIAVLYGIPSILFSENVFGVLFSFYIILYFVFVQCDDRSYGVWDSQQTQNTIQLDIYLFKLNYCITPTKPNNKLKTKIIY